MTSDTVRRTPTPDRRAPRRAVLSIGIALALGVAAAPFSSADALAIRVDEDAFIAGSGLITFSEFPLGTIDPTYAPADYGGGAGSPTVTFDGYFDGQTLSGDPGADCPGAAATACVVGSPTAPLGLDAGAPDTEIVEDGANPTSPVLSGTPTFDGPIAVLFSEDQFGVGFDGGFFDAAESTGITAFARDGSLLGTVTNEGEGIEFLGLVTDSGVEEIAGVFLDLVGSEPAGFAIDNIRFGRREEIREPGETVIPVPAALPLLGLGVIGLAAFGRRRRG